MAVFVRPVFLLSLFVALTYLFAGQPPATAQGLFPTKFSDSMLTVETGDGKRHMFRVEVARTPRQQRRGLMFRRKLDADAGMLFFYGETQIVRMWMKNTYIPLDMIFIRADGKIMEIAERTVPGSLATISSGVEVNAVLEVNGGTVSRLGIGKGDTVLHGYFGNASK